MKHFTIRELTRSKTAERLGINNSPSPEAVENLEALIENVLEAMRYECYPMPIRVNSGYRCPALNKAVGGVPGSQHLLGEAADITLGSREQNIRLANLAEMRDIPYDQLIVENGGQWLHVSHRRKGGNRRQFIVTGKK